MSVPPRLSVPRPSDWLQLSHDVRFVRARGCCEQCGRPHGQEVRCLPDGRWFDADAQSWRDGQGHPADWPDVVDYARYRTTRVVLAACRRDHDPDNNGPDSDGPDNLVALCRRCHLRHQREARRQRFRIAVLRRRALGDLFLGHY